eukprot:COSAG01_NODE_17749_length_1126_cov_41.011685_1_plen_92_part_10
MSNDAERVFAEVREGTGSCRPETESAVGPLGPPHSVMQVACHIMSLSLVLLVVSGCLLHVCPAVDHVAQMDMGGGSVVANDDFGGGAAHSIS